MYIAIIFLTIIIYIKQEYSNQKEVYLRQSLFQLWSYCMSYHILIKKCFGSMAHEEAD